MILAGAVRARAVLAAVLAAAVLGTTLVAQPATAARPETFPVPFDPATLGSTIWTPEEPVAGTTTAFVEPPVPWTPRVTTVDPDDTQLQAFSIGGIPVGVSRRSGHLVIGVRDAVIAGPGTPLAFDRGYDSGSVASAAVGIGWASTLDRGLRIEDWDAVVYSPGERLVFESGDFGISPKALGSDSAFAEVALSTERTYLRETAGGLSEFYSAKGYLTAEVDAEGNGNVFRYDESGRLILIEQLGTGASLHLEYEGFLLAAVRDSAGRTTSYGHDDDGRLTSVTSRSNVRTEFAYDYLGRLSELKTPANDTALRFDYERSGRTTAVTLIGSALAVPERTGFDWSDSGVTMTDARGGIQAFPYDVPPVVDVPSFTPDDLRAAPSELASPLTVLGYDGVGRLTSLVRRSSPEDPGLVSTFAYDRDDRLVSAVATDGSTSWYGYNPDGTVDYSLDGRQLLTEFRYDGAGRLIETSAGTLTDAGPLLVTTIERDAAGNVTADTIDGLSTRYGYGPTGLVTSIEEPGGDCASAGDRPTAASGCTLLRYDAQDREVLRIFPGGARQSTVYNRSGHVLRIDAMDGDGSAVLGLIYTYVESGSSAGLVRTRVTVGEEGIDDGTATSYRYDANQRLVSAVESSVGSSRASWSFGYDAAGNRVKQTRMGATALGRTPAEPSSTISYRYNSLGQLFSTSADSNLRRYDAAGNPLQPGTIPQPGTVAPSPSVARIPTTRTPQGGLVGYRDGTSHYYVTDLQGSVVGSFDSSGRYEGGVSYSPFGEVRAIAPALAGSPNRFAGGEQSADRPGIYRIGVRDYDPSLGRYLTPSPLDPTALSYGYAHQDPINIVSDGITATTVIALRWTSLAQLGLELLSCRRGSFEPCFLTFGLAWLAAGTALVAALPEYPDPDDHVPTVFATVFADVLPLLISLGIFVGFLHVRRGDPDFGEGRPWDWGWRR